MGKDKKDKKNKRKWSYEDFKEFIDEAIVESEKIIKTKLKRGDRVKYINKENDKIHGAIGVVVGFKVGKKSGEVMATVTFDGKDCFNLYAEYLERDGGFIY